MSQPAENMKLTLVLSRERHFTWHYCTVHVSQYWMIVNLSILNHFNKTILVHSGLIEIFLLSNCFRYIPERSFRFNWTWMRFVFLPKKIELMASIEFDWLDRVRWSKSRVRLIKLTEKVQLEYVRLPNQSNNNPTDWSEFDWVRLIFGSVRSISYRARKQTSGI